VVTADGVRPLISFLPPKIGTNATALSSSFSDDTAVIDSAIAYLNKPAIHLPPSYSDPDSTQPPTILLGILLPSGFPTRASRLWRILATRQGSHRCRPGFRRSRSEGGRHHLSAMLGAQEGEVEGFLDGFPAASTEHPEPSDVPEWGQTLCS